MPGNFAQPQTTAPQVSAIVDDAKAIVQDKFTEALDYADGALKTAEGFLNELQAAAASFDFTVPSIGILFPAPISPYFNPGDPPEAPDVELYLPEFPAEPILAAIGLVTGIQASLEAILASGGTGLNSAVEDDIWRREEERARIAVEEAKEKIAAEWSKRGFSLPDGVLASQIAQVEIEYQNKRLDVSRDIAIKQAEMAFQNTQFIIQQILALETLLVQAVSEGNKNLMTQFAAELDGYKTRVQAAVEKMGAYLKLYDTSGTVYKSKAEAQAAIANVDVHAAEASINAAISQMQLFLRQAEVNMKNAEVSAQIRVAAAEGGARVAATLASGMFAGVSVQAHISASGGATQSYSGQESLSESHTYQEK